MRPFLSEDFLLMTNTAQSLYHDFAENMPIFDFHSHLPAREIAENRNFENFSKIWLEGDHYKWRAMRANGIEERYITGERSDRDKFSAWAATVPHTLRNPLYHWVHLELKRFFGIDRLLLGPDTAEHVYHTGSQILQTREMRPRSILQQMNVKVVCTTDDPTDSLAHHQRIGKDKNFPIRVLPTFRPDRSMALGDPAALNRWISRLEAATDRDIKNYAAYLEAIDNRHAYFHEAGCRVSDHGLEHPYAEDIEPGDMERIFAEVRNGHTPDEGERRRFSSGLLLDLARMNANRGWTQQFHIGVLRNTNTRAMQALGPDSGYDTMSDGEIARPLAKFLDNLEREHRLTKTVLYTLNPRDNEMIAAMTGNFQDGSLAGKIQFGPAWWFNDQKDGIRRHLDAVSNIGLLSRFIGMATDARSFLSFARHEYFRRILCNLLGREVEAGELPTDLELIGTMIRDICYNNAVGYFGITPLD